MLFTHLTEQEIIDHLCGVEAGYVDHPSDTGKPLTMVSQSLLH